jgi:outer membrane lipoprotein-sorting protein
MKNMILLAVLALVCPAWAQAPAAAQPATEAAKPAPNAVKTARAAKKRTSLAKRQEDARHCLQQPNNEAIIRCAEEYL